MKSRHWSQYKLPTRTAKRLLFALLLSLILTLMSTPWAGAADPPPVQWHSAQPAAATVLQSLTLQDCIQLALQRQPRVAAQRASLAAAEDGCRALEALLIPVCLDRELPIRRRQASLGVTAAAAGVDQAERETVYAVTRTYFTVLYAREQERVAKGVVDRITATRNAAKKAVEGGSRDVTNADVDRATVYIHLAEVKRIQANQGVKRALAALKEAIGFGPDAAVDVPPGQLPEPEVRLSREEIVAWALARRGEMVRAGVFVDVTCLEIEAQQTCLVKRKETFAAGSDIHAVQVPQGVHNNEYRPSAVPPEMPTLLVGSRPERVKHAQDLNIRAKAVADVTRNLITLEAEDALARWEEASRQIAEAREAAQTGDRLAEGLSKDYAAGVKIKVEDVINSRVLASQARSQYNEYLYRQILALADLERITAGGFCAGLAELIAPRLQVTPESKEAK